MLRVLSTAAIVALSVSVLASQSAQTPDTVARALQEHYGKVIDFKADFTQVVRDRFIRTPTNGAGTVFVKKPGRMRWEYTKPEKHTIVSDGVKTYTHYADEPRVYMSDVPADGDTSPFLLFLSGKGDIARDFIASRVDTPTPGTVALKLTPRKPEPDVEFLVIVVDQKSMQFRQLMKRDSQGGESTLTFSNLKENTRIPDKTFVFTMPRNAEVVTEDGTGRR